jgi:hypothetical protein
MPTKLRSWQNECPSADYFPECGRNEAESATEAFFFFLIFLFIIFFKNLGVYIMDYYWVCFTQKKLA